MKGLKTIILFLLTTQVSLAQVDTTFQRLVSSTNQYLELYQKLHPHDDYHAFSELIISEADRKEIWKEREYYEFVTRDSIGAYDIISFLQGKILTGLDSILQHPDFGKNDIRELLYEEMSIVVSDDHQLYNFSIDEKTGGTYRSRISVMHYVQDEKLNLTKLPETDWETPTAYAAFANDGYDFIHNLSSEGEEKYLLLGNVRGCSYCFFSYAMIVTLKDSMFVAEFSYSTDSRDYSSGIDYSPETKTLTVEYTTDDLTMECGCENEVEIIGEDVRSYWNQDEEELIEQLCTCTFQYDGERMVLIKSTEEKIKD